MSESNVIPLNEGYYTIGFDKVFHPFDPDHDVLEHRSRGSLLVEIQPFLIQFSGKNILIDTGLGFVDEESGELKIIENLAENGLRPHDITDVVMSHLHKDHAGGLLYENEKGWNVTFDYAVHHIYQEEYQYAIDEKNALSYDTEKIRLLETLADIQWFDEKKIFDFMTYENDGGHCPYHCSFLFDLPHGKFFFGGDVAPQIKQLKFRYMAKYDYDRKRSSEKRAEYAKRGKEEDWTFLFYHDVNIPMSKL